METSLNVRLTGSTGQYASQLKRPVKMGSSPFGAYPIKSIRTVITEGPIEIHLAVTAETLTCLITGVSIGIITQVTLVHYNTNQSNTSILFLNSLHQISACEICWSLQRVEQKGISKKEPKRLGPMCVLFLAHINGRKLCQFCIWK